MTEQELIDLGFEKVDILDKDSQNGYDYYIYQKELCDSIVLYSTPNTDVQNDYWELNCFDIPAIRIKSKDHFMQFLEVMDLITC
jgi:hypothetical protein